MDIFWKCTIAPKDYTVAYFATANCSAHSILAQTENSSSTLVTYSFYVYAIFF